MMAMFMQELVQSFPVIMGKLDRRSFRQAAPFTNAVVTEGIVENQIRFLE